MAAAALLVDVRDAHADTAYHVTVSGKTITVRATAGWHINKEYNWKLRPAAGAPVDRSRFELADDEAILRDAPAGRGNLKGAVCKDDRCVLISLDVTAG
jgi:hypothetical protein